MKFARRADIGAAEGGGDALSLVMVVEGQVLLSTDSDHPTFKSNFTLSADALRGPFPSAAASDYHEEGFANSSNGPQISLVPGASGSVVGFSYTTAMERSEPGGGRTNSTCEHGANAADCLPFTHVAYRVQEFAVVLT